MPVTLEDIAKGLEKVRAQIPTIQAGITGLAKTKVSPATTTPKTPITPTKPTELYDVGKIQTDLTKASTEKKKAYDELIGLQSKTYETEYNKIGLGDLKTKAAEIDTNIAEEKRIRDESIDKVRRNPYYSAATITGEAAEIERTSNNRINRLIDQRNSIASQFNAGIDDITRKVGYATTDAQIKYNFWESEEKRISDLVTAYSAELRKQLEKAEKVPEVFGTAETGYYQWIRDPATGKWDKQMIIPPVPKVKEYGLQLIKDEYGRIVGYFDPATGKITPYTPAEPGAPGAPGVLGAPITIEDKLRIGQIPTRDEIRAEIIKQYNEGSRYESILNYIRGLRGAGVPAEKNKEWIEILKEEERKRKTAGRMTRWLTPGI